MTTQEKLAKRKLTPIRISGISQAKLMVSQDSISLTSRKLMSSMVLKDSKRSPAESLVSRTA